MATGLPVIVSTRIGNNIPEIQDGVTGFVVDPDDVDGLECRLRQLLENPDLRKQLGQRAREAVLPYSFQSNRELFERFFSPVAHREFDSVTV
jgi:glycosyltransferase involved in cell wall biosynthesis